jgi:putative ABC transport system ATP-binding protein
LQQSHFVEALSVLDNLIFSSWLSTGHKNKKYALDLLNELNIIDHQHKLTKQLSVGQQQRLSIARALIASPKVLLADEPTSSLDDDNTYLVANLLQSLAAKFQTALVIVSHDQRLKNIFPQHLNLQKHVS